jgi:hypothetical protein
MGVFDRRQKPCASSALRQSNDGGGDGITVPQYSIAVTVITALSQDR